MKTLLKEYKEKKAQIKDRLLCFESVYKKDDKDIFTELCFCILTPQSKAVICDAAIKRLDEKGRLLKGSQRSVRSCLKGVRFPNNKARYLVMARGNFKNGKGLEIKKKIDDRDLRRTRDWFVKNVKGLGYKEASHFLRNIGLGKDLAILDRHILKNLKRYGIIKKVPGFLSRKEYIKIEDRMKEFFKRVNMSLDEVDLLFWSKETGFIFK
ncbi:MAG: N-glycosylase/DNA lyase [Candidatus Omnitrophica bacterium]|nr:N-glycosylase/DNA lyase [Candidatus Omnitrophota bacterium]MBU4458165.1 N-glycosylase/DNA lyase [Candidatus Omnitrophota bacterium]